MSTVISKHIVASVCFLFGMVSSLLPISCNENLSKTNEIRGVVDRYHTALVRQDEEVLNSTLAERLRIMTSFEDSILSKSDLLERYRSLDGKLESADVRDVRVEVNESNATVKCFVRMLFISKSSNVISHEAVYTYGLEKIDGKWKITSIQQQSK